MAMAYLNEPCRKGRKCVVDQHQLLFDNGKLAFAFSASLSNLINHPIPSVKMFSTAPIIYSHHYDVNVGESWNSVIIRLCVHSYQRR
ncbi:hypothetical protein D917_05847 [Trichinella nativa]|uniref:Uncharacterized protein n=1 Tax=Trichinella nativa TaxID=6335 RepID=A0A1Y3EUX1_9BILA|nr:hypothetical protein D917_05847 [Trichinella nativa]